MGTATWTPHFRTLEQPEAQQSQAPGFAKPAAAPQHSRTVCSSFLPAPVTGAAAPTLAKHTQILQNALSEQWAATKTPLIDPNAPSRQGGEQWPGGRGGVCLLKPTCGVGNKGEQETDRLPLTWRNRDRISVWALKEQPQQEQSFDAEDYQPRE